MEEKKQREIIVIDNVAPEAVAMIQAKYSRSPRSAKIHLEEVAKVGPEKFMAVTMSATVTNPSAIAARRLSARKMFRCSWPKPFKIGLCIVAKKLRLDTSIWPTSL